MMRTNQAMSFELPEELNATTPPERRGVRRDFVRMMVLDRRTGRTTHTRFYELDRFLQPGDLLVLNASRTIPAVLRAEWRRDGGLVHGDVEIRLSRRISEAVWEAFAVTEGLATASVAGRGAPEGIPGSITTGDRLQFAPELDAIVTATNEPFVTLRFSAEGAALYDHIYRLGEPVRYEYIRQPWQLDYYQTIYGSVPGSVEMPSAGRAFSWELLFKLQRHGVRIAFIELHTGLTYLLDDKWHRTPRDHFEEFRIPEETAHALNETRAAGGRVVAVGTTVVRALETAALGGQLTAQSGLTNLQIDEHFPLQATDGLITGFHEPEASHLDLLSAFIDPLLLHAAYQEATSETYLWHEFGDMNLIL